MAAGFGSLNSLVLKNLFNIFDNVWVDHLKVAVYDLLYIFQPPLKNIDVFHNLLLSEVIHVQILQEMNPAKTLRVRINNFAGQPIIQVEAMEKVLKLPLSPFVEIRKTYHIELNQNVITKVQHRHPLLHNKFVLLFLGLEQNFPPCPLHLFFLLFGGLRVFYQSLQVFGLL